MDPNATLADIIRLMGEIDRHIEEQDTDAALFAWDEIKDRAIALDAWLRQGGFLPERWHAHPHVNGGW